MKPCTRLKGVTAVKVAAVQHDIIWEDPVATRKQVEPMIAAAAAGGARLICLTEMYATGFSMRPERIAEDEGGPNEQFLLDQAREHDAWLVGLDRAVGADGRARNNAVARRARRAGLPLREDPPVQLCGRARALRGG